MSAVQPRLRMFAGPNGSGKSTLKDVLEPQWLEVYVNADDIEAVIKANGWFSLEPYGVQTTQDDFRDGDVGRVAMGKHNVPRDKIIDRYHRSLALLADAVTCADRAYVFDNSDIERVWVAEVIDGTELELKMDTVPYWFKTALLDKLTDEDLGVQ